MLGSLRMATRRDLVSFCHHPIPKFYERYNFASHAEEFRGFVLDIGCGHQPYARILDSRKVRYVGVDVAAAVSPHLVADSASLPVKDGICDVVLCMQLLEHVVSPELVLSEVYRILRPAGLIYISVPMTWALHYEPHDYRRFTSHGLKMMLKDAGFEVQVLRRYGGLFSIIGALLADWLFERVRNALRVFPPRIGLVAALLASVSTSFVFGTLAAVLDRLDHRYALGWIALAQKKPREKRTSEADAGRRPAVT